MRGEGRLDGRGEEEEEESIYPDAACNPNPLLPPVTTTTFPLREKMLGKSRRSISGFDVMIAGAVDSASVTVLTISGMSE